MLGLKLSDLTSQSDIPLSTYHNCLVQIYNPPLPECYLGACSSFPGITRLKDEITAIMDDNMIDNVVFKEWVSVDRSTLETISKPVDEFVELFCEKLELFLPHSFIVMQHASFYKDCMSML